MPATTSSDLKFGIGHVLFMDIVEYSKLVIDKQTELIRRSTRLCAIRNSSAWPSGKKHSLGCRRAMEWRLFFGATPEAPAQCAVEGGTAL